MRTALTVLVTAVLTAIAIFSATQSGLLSLGNYQNDIPLPGESGNSCITPWGEVVNHGESLLSFSEPTPTILGQTQSCESRTITCDDGKRYRDIEPLPYQSCILDTLENCTINGFVLAHGSAQIFYTVESIDGRERCDSQTRTCTNGIIDGDERYTHLHCPITDNGNQEPEENSNPEVLPQPLIEEPVPAASSNTSLTPATQTLSSLQTVSDTPYNCPSPRGGSAWADGRTSIAYLQSATLDGQCESTNIVCAYGSIRYGTPDNIGESVQGALYASCGVRAPYDCNSACGTVEHNSTLTTYQVDTLSYSEGVCTNVQIISTCTDGVLAPDAGEFCSCEVRDPVSCTDPNGNTVAHGTSLTLYQHAEVQAIPGDGSDTCVRQRRKCYDGRRQDYNGDTSPFTFTHTSCTVLPPTEGDGQGGEGLPQ